MPRRWGQVGVKRRRCRAIARRARSMRNIGHFGGGAGIRTQGDPKASAVFKTAAFDRSATPPELSLLDWHHRTDPRRVSVCQF